MSVSLSENLNRILVDRADEVRTTVKNCADEAIRIPGSIQRHGFFLLLDERGTCVVAASDNAAEYLEIPLRLILGTPVGTVLERELLATIKAHESTSHVEGQLLYLGNFPLRKELYSVVTHVVDGHRVLEFEKLERLFSPELMNAVITNFVGTLSKLRSEVELCSAITKQIRDLTGFNRVLLYSFDEEGHGVVLSEENDGTLPSYLDLHFPASDIPKQARELYVLNTVRIIPDATYVPSPLIGSAGRPMKQFDLSASVLRSVSPIHVEYMRNMGTMASMSISIVIEGRLWGLISCHNALPRTVPYVVRSACDLLTKMVGTQLLAFRNAAQLERAVHFHGVQRGLFTHLASEHEILAALISKLDEVSEVTHATGAALILDGQCFLGGKTPNEAEVLRLADWLEPKIEGSMAEGSGAEAGLFASRHLAGEIDWAEGMRAVASGLLAVRISGVRKSYLLWFRPELATTVRWAGELNKAGDQTLRPRTSFDSWQELVRGKSAPWTEMEIESAQEFRSAIVTIGLKRAEEAVQVSEARFEQLTDTLPNLVWAADDAGQLTYANNRWGEEGLSAEGRWYEQARISRDAQERLGQLWDRAVAEGRPFEQELELQESSGMLKHWNLARAVPFKRSDGSRAGWVGTFTDLTKQRENEMAARMTEKLALTGRMTSVIAHEINNPLEALTNLHYLLSQEVVGNESASSYLKMAASELDRISGITKQTLRWSKETNQHLDSSSCAELFEDVLRLLAGKIRNRELVVETSGEHIPVYGIVGQLRQVLANLVSNAIDASPVGGRVCLKGRASDEFTEIVVEDVGSGISKEAQKLLFQPFFSTKGDLGNGLGLYISQEIMERHKGKLLVGSEPGRGTVMTMRLPAR